MKRIFALFISAICILTILLTCNNLGEQPRFDLSKTTKINVLHYIRGREESWTIEDKVEIEILLNWLDNLSLKLKHYEKGDSPGDSNGGEIYMFSFDGGEFSYIKNGSTDCYVFYKSDWYQVKNPTDPFVD